MVAPRANPLGLALSRAAAPQSIAPPQGPSARALAAQRDFLANQLQNSMQDDPRDVGEGVADLANTALAGYLGYRNDQATEQATTAANQALVNALQGGKASIGDVIGPATNEFANQGLAQYALEQAGKGPEKDPLVKVVQNGVVNWIPQSQASGMQAELPAAPEGPSSSIAKIQADLKAGFITPEQAQAAIAKENYIAPQTPKDPTEQWVPYEDPATHRTGQKSMKTGKIDWDPGNTMMVQTGVDDKGNPIYSLQSGGGSSKPPTEDQAKADQLYTRSVQQLPIVLDNFDSLGEMQNQIGNMLPGAAASFVTSPEYQRASNALTDIAASYLYSVSGATANPGEVANLVKTVTPVIHESDASKADKKERIKQMVESIKLRKQPAQTPATVPGAPNPTPVATIPPPPPGFQVIQ